MRLRSVDFGPVTGQSGVQGFFGEGYRFHRYWRPFGLDFAGMTFVAKTTTLEPRKGNMPLRADFTPQEFRPKCIVVSFQRAAVLNSVGLSGPGAWALLATGKWQARTEPFFLSFMSVGKFKEDRLEELRDFTALLVENLPRFRAPVGLQLNFSCPNTGHALVELVDEIGEALDVAAVLGIPLMPKLNLLVPVATAKEVSDHPACDALCVSNTIPWADVPVALRLELFGSMESPLAHLGGGGLSGSYLLPLLLRWLHDARDAGIRKPLNAGGGILSTLQARAVKRAAGPNSSVALGSVAILRPWRVRGIIGTILRMEY